MAFKNINKILPIAKGEYNSSLAYLVLDIVKHDGRSWIARKDVAAGIEPSITNAEYWQSLVDKSDVSISEDTDNLLVKDSDGNLVVKLETSVWSGTQAEFDAAVAAGTIKDGTLTIISDAESKDSTTIYNKVLALEAIDAASRLGILEALNISARLEALETAIAKALMTE